MTSTSATPADSPHHGNPSGPAAECDPAPVYDLVGIGIGPFNLGLAALADPLVASGELSALFLDRAPGFCWHPGMLLPNATIQVPFMADLVTMADPTSRYSFLNYCKLQGRIHRFFIKEDFYPLRREYSDYCAWVAGELGTLRWSSEVVSVVRAALPAAGDATAPGQEDEPLWAVTYRDVGATSPAPVGAPAATHTVYARSIVSGVGTQPFVPAPLREALGQRGVYHSSDYLHHRDDIRAARSVTIVGSGQSAAEIYRDLMEDSAATGRRLDWVTRSPRFFPMEYTKLTLELTSPEYAQYFHGLPMDVRDATNRRQRNLYKGISGETINVIYDTYYRLSLDTDLPRPFDSTLRPGWSARWEGLVDASRPEDAASEHEEAPGATSTGAAQPTTPDHPGHTTPARIHRLALTHEESGASLTQESEVLILATGYRGPGIPTFLDPAREHIHTDEQGRFAVTLDFTVDDRGSVFVQNAEEHTHSLTAPDLGMGPWRNSVILSRVLGREVYPIERHIAFQTFGLVDGYRPPALEADAHRGRTGSTNAQATPTGGDTNGGTAC